MEFMKQAFKTWQCLRQKGLGVKSLDFLAKKR